MSLDDFSVDLRLSFESPEKAGKILRIMGPELRLKKDRSQTTLKAEGKSIDFSIRAGDSTALRASFNTYFKSIMLANEILSNDY